MRKKKIISVLLAASMVFATTLQGNGVITMADEPDSEVAVQTEAGVKSGTCGENLTWELKDGTLTISGSGEMYNYYLLDGAPWYRETSAIDKIVIDENVKTIGDYAFYECSGLTSISIPDSVTSIGWCAFWECSGLTSINIPNSVTSIGNRAFYGCSGLTSISVESENTVYDSRNNCNAIIETVSNELIQGCQSTIIPDTVTSIGDSAFEGCSSLTSISIPYSVTSIGKGAFEECSSLTSINIPNSVTSIGDSAFEACDKLVIYCDKGSYAESYAKKNNISYAELMHNFETIITKAVTSTDPKKCTNAKKIIKCKECGFIKESNVICYYAKDIQLSSRSYTYDGKAKKPAVTVKDANGNVIAATNYKVTYSGNVNTGTGKVIVTMNKDSNYKGTITKTFTIAKASSKITGTTAYTKTARTKAQRFTLGVKATGGKLAYKSSNSKKVAVNNKGQVKIAANFSGKAVITVTARGANYKTATKKVTITVKPAATKLTRVKNIASKKATIKWTKLAYASGYQVQYSYKSNFKSAKSVTVSKASNVSKTIKKLVKNKTLYVRVRAYKTVGKTKLYGAWSAKKSVRIRK